MHIPLPPDAPGAWCHLQLRLPPGPPWWAKVEATDEARGHIVRSAFLGPAQRGARGLLLHVPLAARALDLTLFGRPQEAQADARLRVLSRTEAALRLLASGWRKLPACLSGDPSGLMSRLRAELGQGPARSGEAPPYAHWIARYDRWGAAERSALSARAAPPIELVIESGEGQAGLPRGRMSQAEAATVESVRAGWVQPASIHIPRLDPEASRAQGAWLLAVRAGDVLAPQALACFAHLIAGRPEARIVTADCDVLVGGQRAAPIFKPAPDPWLAATGLPTLGACAFAPGVPARLADFTGAASGQAALRHACAVPAHAWAHIPFVLTHLGTAPQHAAPAAPPPAPAGFPRVSIIIPSACRKPHVLACLQRLLDRTEYPDYEILLAVSEKLPNDRTQAGNLRAAARLPHVRVLDLGLPTFNYPQVNNIAAAAATGSLLLLLNDDVAPIRPDWLQRMVAFALHEDAPCGIVGARLLYGNDRVQHGGVIMGLADLCEHAFRLTDRADAGPSGIARLDRQVCAVTAACMLVHAELFHALGGMDENFAIALNDVDFCLRARQSGARVLFAGSVELYHYESLSLGRHYQGARAGLEALEVTRLRAAWQSVIADDPHYNPRASLEPGREFQPAFPPRLSPLGWIMREGA